MATFGQWTHLGPYFSGGLLCTLKVYHYASGTTTLQDVWSDREKTATVAQPATSDAEGVVGFYGDGLYKFRIDGATDGVNYSTLYTIDKWAVGDQSSSTLTGEGAAITSAATLTLGTDGNIFHVTGSTGPITAISGTQGVVTLVFDSTPTLTHSGNLILYNSASWVAAAGDVLSFFNEGAGIWRETSRRLASGLITASGLTQATARLLGRTTASTGAIEEITVGNGLTMATGSIAADTASETVDGIVELATQAEVNAMTDTGRVITPNHNKLVMGTYTAIGAVTSFTISSIPAGVRRVTIELVGVSTGSTADYILQLGDAGDIETSGYLGAGATVVNASSPAVSNATAHFIINQGPAAAGVYHGTITLTLADAATFRWMFYSVLARSDSTSVHIGAGTKATSAELTRVQISAGGDTFDAGSYNVTYER